MILIATRQIYSSAHGQVIGGQEFDWPDSDTANLLATGAARHPYPPRIRYDTKPAVFETQVIMPEAPEVSARLPFRDVPLSDEEPASVASESNRVLPQTDVSEPRVAHSRGRRRRAGSGR